MLRPRSGLFGFFAFLHLKPHATDDGAASAHDAVSPSGGHFLAAVFPGAHSQTPLSDGVRMAQNSSEIY